MTTVHETEPAGKLYKTSTGEFRGIYDMPFRLRFTTRDCVDWIGITY